MPHIFNVYYDNLITNWRSLREPIRHNILVLVVEGKVNYHVDNSEVTAERGDFIFFPEGIRRSGENHPSGFHRKYTIVIAPSKNTNQVPLLSKQQYVKFKPHNFQYIQKRFEKLYEESLNRDPYQAVIGNGILEELLGLLSREMEKPEVPSMKVKFANIIKDYLIEHYHEQIEISQLAQLIQRSPNYTTAIFREVIGHSPINYMHQLRIMEACNLLIGSDMTIAHISSHLGFYDTSYFFRIFKKYTGMSPTEFIAKGQHINVSQLFL